MRCIVLFYTFCLYFRLHEFVPTESSGKRRIIGGKNADEDKFAYIVRLQYQILFNGHGDTLLLKQLHSCTAAVLTPIWSLSAAHCFLFGESLNVKIQNISTRLIVIYGPVKKRAVSEVLRTVSHPAYKLRYYDLSNDIGLTKHEPIILKEYARVSALDYVTMIGQEVTLTGYGITNATAIIGDKNPQLIEIASDATTLGLPLQFLDAVVVNCEQSAKIKINGGMCLARACGQMSGLCPGDSGGPLLHQSGVVAVNSIGSLQIHSLCNLQPHPAFYDPAGVTPTSPYIDWISKIIKNEVPERKTLHKNLKMRKLKIN